ncbi:MAG: hypothetical protein ACRCTQ_03790 [Brevinemataceae bacterium]
MLLILLKNKITLYTAAVGAIVMFVIALFQQVSFFRILYLIIVGGAVGIILWIGVLMLVIYLLSQEDIAVVFKINQSSSANSTDPTSNTILTDQDSNDDLTMEELYTTMNNTPESLSNTSPYSEPENISFNNDSEFNNFSTDSNTQTKLDSDQTFTLTTANGKTLRTNPKETADAIRTVLSKDKD